MASALLWNYCFLPPRYTFHISSFQDAMMFGMFFAVALAMGQLTARLRAQQTAEREREERATALYLLTRELAGGKDFTELLSAVIRQLGDGSRRTWRCAARPGAQNGIGCVSVRHARLVGERNERGHLGVSQRKPAGCTPTRPPPSCIGCSRRQAASASSICGSPKALYLPNYSVSLQRVYRRRRRELRGVLGEHGDPEG
jgi:K+-sensing histidine kinase KdpD